MKIKNPTRRPQLSLLIAVLAIICFVSPHSSAVESKKSRPSNSRKSPPNSPAATRTNPSSTSAAASTSASTPSTSSESAKSPANSSSPNTSVPHEPSATDVPPPSVSDEISQKAGKAIDDVGDVLDQAQVLRTETKYFGVITFSPADLLIPMKKGLSLGWNQSVEKSYELEYLSGSLAAPSILKDLGEMSDTRISLLVRSYGLRNSFNFSYGVSYYDFSIHLGSAIMSRYSGGFIPELDLVTIQGLGANVGVGNRWLFKKNITFGVDWLSLYQPLVSLKRESIFLDRANNQKDKDDVDTAMKTVGYFPRFVLFKLQLGMSF